MIEFFPSRVGIFLPGMVGIFLPGHILDSGYICFPLMFPMDRIVKGTV